MPLSKAVIQAVSQHVTGRTRQGATEEEAVGGNWITSEYPQIPFFSLLACPLHLLSSSRPCSFLFTLCFCLLCLVLVLFLYRPFKPLSFEGIGDASHPLELRSAPFVGLTLSSNSLSPFFVDTSFR